MSVMQCACPRCQLALQITQALPVSVQCPRCQSVFTVADPAAAPASPSPPSSADLLQTGRAAGPLLLPRSRPSRQPLTTARGPGRAVAGVIIGASAIAVALLLVVAIVWLRGESKDSVKEKDKEGPARDMAASKIDQAVERGVKYLKEQLLSNERLYHFNGSSGPHVGATALAGLTLLECDVPADDPAVQRALQTVRGEGKDLTFTYAVALAVLFLDRYWDAKKMPPAEQDVKLIRTLAVRLIASQNEHGGWDYECLPLRPYDVDTILTQLRKGAFRPGGPLPAGLVRPRRDDNSIVQFATLALWNARKHGVPAEPALLAVEERYREKQRGDGSWTYNDQVDSARDATTCAGMIGLAAGRAVREEAKRTAGLLVEHCRTAGFSNPACLFFGRGARLLIGNEPLRKSIDVRQDESIARGLKYLARVIGKQSSISSQLREQRRQRTEDMDRLQRSLFEEKDEKLRSQIWTQIAALDTPELATGMYFGADAWGDVYFLWSVERVGMLFDLPQIEGKDWYAWGSQILLANQQEDGSWRERFPGVPDTCFALLFLKRANVIKDLTDKLRDLARPSAGAAPGRPAPGPGAPPRKE